MKQFALTAFLLFSFFTFSQNCLYVLDVKNYRKQGNYSFIKKRKNIQIILKTKDCLCTENVFEYFVNSKYYTNGKIVSSDYHSNNKRFLLENKLLKIEIDLNNDLVTITETRNNKTKKYISDDFVLESLD